MGNRLGHSKEARKPKEDKRSEEDAQKGGKQKEKQKKRLGHNVVDPEADFDESSHVTGGDSESCVFHSAENISFSPYLDSSTRSEHEQGTSWSEVLQQAALGAQHPYVLSSKDFQDGFSLEACIPSEIARLGEYNDVSSTTKSRYGHRNPSLNSSTASKSSMDPKASFSGPHSPATGNHGINTSAISSPQTGTTDKLKVPSSPTSTPIQKSTRNEWQEKQPLSPTGGLHHPHFYNHNRTYQQLSPLPVIKPTSPQPQRKLLLPKTSTPSKSATSESPSPSPSTPGPQRRAANFLALFRSGSKLRKAAGNNDEDSKTDSTADETRGRSYSTSNDSDLKVKSKPTWKTWERPRSKKSKKPIKDSIFGTSRKSDTKPSKDYTEDNTQAANKDETTEASVASAGNLLDTGTSINQKKIQNRATYVVQTTQKQSQMSPGCSHFEAKSNNEKVSSVESGQAIRSHSPPLPSRAAVCIMKLEELERSIEKTIREKFPDAEPFLIQKRSKEELHGSRSLPTTPSNKKKLPIVRNEGTQLVNTKLHKDMTRYYNETYESPPSPSASPVVLRRFGARTRHASISPKTQRAKTAALFNSPSEMSTFGASRTEQSTTAEGPLYHRLSSDQASHPETLKMFSVAQKSESKYDNVMGDEETVTPVVNSDSYYPHRHDMLKDKNKEQVIEASIDDNSKNGREQSKVIIPTFSAVFGSVSPKLRRHLQVKFDEINDNIDEDKTHADKDVQLANQSNKNETSRKVTNGSQKAGNEVVRTGPSLECLESSHMAPGLAKPTEKTRQERSPQFAGQPDVNGERKKALSHKERNTASETVGTAPLTARTGGINSSQSGLRAPRGRGAEAGCDHNTGLGVISPLHVTGKPANEAEQGNVVSCEHRKPSACAVSSHITQSGTKITAESGQLSSSATKRTHSTDRVLLFESVVLSPPDGSAPISPFSQPSPEQKSTCLEKNSDIAQAQHTTSNQLHACTCASNGNTVDNLQGEATHSEPTSSSSLTSARDRRLSDTVTFSRETRGDLSQEGVTGDVSLQKCAFVSSILADDEQPSEIRSSESDSLIFDKRDKSKNSKGCFSSLASQKAVHVFCDSGTNGNRAEEQRVSWQHRKDHAKVCKDEDRVLKQPVSEVISQMISRSNLQKQQHERHRQEQQQQQQQQQQQKQQQRLRSNIISPDYTVIQPQLATVQKYEQLSEVLEKRCVKIPADPTTVNINNELRQSRCQEIQTDCYTTADKGVDSHELTDATENFGLSKSVQTVNSLVSPEGPGMESKEEEQANLCSEKEFVKISSDGSQKCESELADESCISEHVPPPSPTALQQLLEEFEEEDDDIADEEEDIQAMATMSREQLEMKEFSDTIYKRLSELLGTNPEDDKDIESNNVSGNEETQDLADEKEGSSTCESSPEITACRSSDSTTRTDTRASIQTGFPVSPLVKILTVETSSSLTTTTSSESDIDDPPLMFHSFQNDENNDDGMFKNNDNYMQRQEEVGDLVFREFDATNLVESRHPDRKPVSREYHSDDDVAKGRGIPDYYDDKPLWSRRQKPPGQLSAAMMAIRWRERRERWLKKRRRNRTDLISTGSSDTGSEYCLNRQNEPADVNYSEHACGGESTQRTSDMGSGILTSPKYTKPILPFFGSQAKGVESETSSHFHSSVHRRKRQDGRWSSNRSGVSTQHATNITQDRDRDRKYVDTNIENKDKENTNEVYGQNSAHVKSSIDAPSIEDTFQELMSVQTILKEMQECKNSADDTEKQGLLPLTTENVRSIREYYKDFYTSGNGRRSRMSATDRTESDLDLYSEIQDDASSESELYADDEGDDDGQEPYATAEDDAGATGRGSNTSCRSNKRDEGRHSKDDDDDSESSLVLSCTFYNSNTHEQKLIDTTEIGPTAIYSYEPKTTHRSISAQQATTSHTNLNSDDEFWTGSASIDESYKQLETAADAVSTTFQNAREQMHDIQYHLQALRRQMEVMQSDLTNVSLSLSQSTSTECFKK